MKRFLTAILGLALMLVPLVSFGAEGTTVGTDLGYNRTAGLQVYKWSWAIDTGTTAVDSTQVFKVTGKVVGVKTVETSVSAAYTIKLLDGAGRDVLQGLFSDTEASATASADSHYRVPIDDTSGGNIYLWDDAIYLDVSSAASNDTGDVYLHIKVQ